MKLAVVDTLVVATLLVSGETSPVETSVIAMLVVVAPPWLPAPVPAPGVSTTTLPPQVAITSVEVIKRKPTSRKLSAS